MPLMDEFKEERDAVKNGTPKQKLAYFWDYYKWYVIVGIAAIIILIATIRDIVNKKEIAFFACMLNLSSEYMDDSATESAKGFTEYSGIDTKEYEVRLDTSFQLNDRADVAVNTSQKLLAYLVSSDIDVIVSDSESVMDLAYNGYFYDMRDFLSPEQLEAYGDCFYYIDNAIVEEAKAAHEAVDLSYTPTYADPFKPEDMKEPIPVGIVLPEHCILKKEYSFGTKAGVISVVKNSKHTDLSHAFIEFIMQ